MRDSMICFSMVFIAFGISAIIFKKYPINNLSFRNLERKYGNVDKKKAIKLDGIFCVIFGAIYLVLGILNIKNTIIFNLTVVFITACLLIVYGPIRRKYLKLK